jgi:DNA-binding MarR family transcriptional regulator
MTDVPHFELLRAPGHLIRRTQQRHQLLWSELVGGDLTSVQFAVLALLHRCPAIDQRTLSLSLSIDTSTTADVCQRLHARRLLERSRDGEDARRYVLRLTADGTALLDATIPRVDAVGEALLAGLAPDEREQLIALLARVMSGPDAQVPSAPTAPPPRRSVASE